jgi:hypothetical protein
MSIEQASKDFAAALLNLATAVAGSIQAVPANAPAKAPKEPKKTAAAAETPKVEGPSAKQVADAVLALAEKNRDTAVAILGKFKANRVSELKPESYAEVLKLVADASAAPVLVANDSLV